MTREAGLTPSGGEGSVRLWLHEDVREAWAQALPSVALRTAQPGPASAGRGTLEHASLAEGSALIRTSRRGGLLRRLLPDVFLGPGRALAEARAAERLAARGLAPPVLAIEARGRVLVRLRVAVRMVPGGRDLLAVCAAAQPPGTAVEIARAAGLAVAAMHDAGVLHADLNAANLLWLSDQRRVVVVDLDAARTTDAPVATRLRVAQVLRLCRSVDKWTTSAATGAAARAAFLRAALPRGARRRALRSARRRHALGCLLGRSPRSPLVLPDR